MKMLIVYHSLYGHVAKMAEAVAEGARSVPGSIVEIKRVPETLPPEILEKMGATAAQKALSSVPVAVIDDLAHADAVVFGTPTRFGNMSAQMKQFIDAAVQLWATDALVGKVASVFTSSATQHGGQESTILSFHTVLLHFGMIVAGLPYSFEGLKTISALSGGSPYGASTIVGGDGSRMPVENELDGARFQGKHVATIAAKLVA